MSKKGKMFPGVTRQVVISDDTHRLLRTVAQHEEKYIGELADEILLGALRGRALDAEYTPSSPGVSHVTTAS